MPFGLWTLMGPRKYVLDGAQISLRMGNYEGKGHAQAWPTTLCRELCKNGWTDRFAFGLWIRMDRRKHKFSRICQAPPMCPHGSAHHGRVHWRQVANTIEPSVCDSDVALCQITLTTCYYRYCYYGCSEEDFECWHTIRLWNLLYPGIHVVECYIQLIQWIQFVQVVQVVQCSIQFHLVLVVLNRHCRDR